MLVLTTSMSMIESNVGAILISVKELKQVTYIQYLIAFPDGVTQDGSALDSVSAVLDSSNEVHIIRPTFVKKLDLMMQIINVGA